jgi:hypothetical protein
MNANLDTGTIEFINPSGVRATAAVQVVGTYSTTEQTWLWAWGDGQFKPSTIQHAMRVLDYGKANGISDFTTSKQPADANKCWGFAAVACKLNHAQGVYTATPTGRDVVIFMTFGNSGEPPVNSTTLAPTSAPSTQMQ